MFQRPPETYDLAEEAVDAALRDPANPLLQTAHSIPAGSVVLDVGAGNGLLARILNRLDAGVVIDGVEPHPDGAAAARQHYREFHQGYAEDLLRDDPPDKYDYVVLNDVVEHLVDPVAFLRELRQAVAPTCKFLLSTPNVAYLGMRLGLLAGRFDYVDSGILERTHVRFFTRTTLLSTLEQAGLHPRKVVYLERRVRETEFASMTGRLRAFTLPWIGRDRMAFTYQFLYLLAQSPGELEELTVGRRDTFLRMVLKP